MTIKQTAEPAHEYVRNAEHIKHLNYKYSMKDNENFLTVPLIKSMSIFNPDQ